MTTQSSDIKNNDIKDNANFVQLSREYLKNMRELARKSPIGHQILYYLVEHMGRTTNAVICSYKTLEEITGVSRASVARAIRILKEDHWMDTIKVGNATAYCINARIFWQATKGQKRLAIFQATVIASESEQPNGFMEKTKQKLKTYSYHRKVSILPKSISPFYPPPDQQDLDL